MKTSQNLTASLENYLGLFQRMTAGLIPEANEVVGSEIHTGEKVAMKM
jgi:hypothetical protein